MKFPAFFGTILISLGIACQLTRPDSVPRSSILGTGGMAQFDARETDLFPTGKVDALSDGLVDPEVPGARLPDAEGPDHPVTADRPRVDLPTDTANPSFDLIAPRDTGLIPDFPLDSSLITAGARVDAAGGVDGANRSGGTLATGGTLGTGGVTGTGGVMACALPYVFCDDFAGGLSRWTAGDGDWDVTPRQTAMPKNAVTGRIVITEGMWRTMTVEASVRVLSFGGTTSAYRAEIYARYQDAENFFALSIRGDGKLGIRHRAINIGNTVEIGVLENSWHRLQLRVAEISDKIWLEAYLDGSLRTTVAADLAETSASFGSAGLGVYGSVMAEFDDVRVSTP